MNYEEFCAGLREYWELFDKGLKKQANKYLFEFADDFKKNVPQAEADELLCRFCRECLDEDHFPEFKRFGFLRLPFQLTGLLNDFLNRECGREKMPHMRWAYQLFGMYYNPHDPKNLNDPYHILERAYAHPDCDQKTAELYFYQQVSELGFGAHHFPEGCCIARTLYEKDVNTAEKILSEKTIDPRMVEEFEYYKKLYEVYYGWRCRGGTEDFYMLCEAAGIGFTAGRAFYYKK